MVVISVDVKGDPTKSGQNTENFTYSITGNSKVDITSQYIFLVE